MAKMKKKKGPVIPGFPDKWAKKLEKGISDLDSFLSDVESMDEARIRKSIVRCNEEVNTCEDDKENNMDLKNAQNEVKELKEPYDNVINCQRAKIKYFLHVMSQRGYGSKEASD